MTQFILDKTLEGDSIFIADLTLCTLRLINDKRWPWLVLMPKRPDIEEVFDLSKDDQKQLHIETNQAAEKFKALTNCEKINIAMIGNVVRQLHVHIIARDDGDANWPSPVWGYGTREPYNDAEIDEWHDKLITMLNG
jgi:diadenosine tetraphosphate (Ap4A) HIT family hydrolase